MKIGKWVGVLAVAGAWMPATSFATDGYFSDGYGIMDIGRGGASIAVAEDSMGGANNPATMGFVGDRLDAGASMFSPDRSASRSGNANGINGTAGSGTNYFVIPEFGYVHALNDSISLGITVYGNGGMNTDYSGGQIPAGRCGTGAPASNLLCGQGRLGVDLSQAIIAPTATYKPTPNNSFGISPLIAYQRFSAQGVQAFTGVSSSPDDVTNRGYSDSFGAGVRIGWMGRVTDTISLGATYSSKVMMSRFQQYQGLFAQQGGFDIPQNFGAGAAFQATPELLLAFDYNRIDYSGVAAVGNPSTNAATLGSSSGPGFGWNDINVYKIGAEYRLNSQWIVRGGYDHSDNPIQPRDVTFNILAPGVIQDQVSVGFTYEIAGGYELSGAYMHAFENSVSGATNSLIPGGGTDKISMSENTVGFALGIKF